MTRIEPHFPQTLAQASLTPRGSVHPSPIDWRDQTLYFLLPDRFSDGREDQRPLYDPTFPDQHRPADKHAWMEAGKVFQGGTLKGIASKLDYLKTLGVTALWIGPIWRQRADLQTYHGYGIQNFLDVDPRFGTRQDLRDLVDAAHAHGMYVLLDIIYNHSGNNWFYSHNGQPYNTLPYRYEPAYATHSWRSKTGEPTAVISDFDDGVWPREFQNFDWYTRAGQIGNWDPAGWENPTHPHVEFRRGDFFDLKDLNLQHENVLNALIDVYRYWIAVSDCDGFRIDTVKHIAIEHSSRFCSAIREYCESIGKEFFWLLGEVTGGEYMKRSYLEIFGQDLDAVLDIGESRSLLIGMTKGFTAPAAYFDQFQPHDVMGGHRETGRYHVTILDDHDMVGSPKRRFAADAHIEAKHEQAAHAIGTLLTTLGVPCIYYGTEQALDGTQDRHDYEIEPGLSFEDRYVRETLFGGTFGAFYTSGCHVFNPDHPTYLRIAAIARVRNREDQIGLALRRGRQYLREIAVNGGDFRASNAGEIAAWSRILFETSVEVALNTHGAERRSAYITVDSTLHPVGSTLTVLYNGAWSADDLRNAPTDGRVSVLAVHGRAAVYVDLPPAGMVILG